jgi:hypothetical protein
MEDNEKLDELKRRELERRELNLLVSAGHCFDVVSEGRKRTFEIHEPTAWVLDCLSALWLEMDMDEEVLKDNEVYLTESKRLVNENAFRMARVVAVAVAGDTYSFNPGVRWVRRLFHRAKVERLTRLFYHTLRPSKLLELSYYILAISNIADFLNSMRLLSGARTTIPIKNRIEKQG